VTEAARKLCQLLGIDVPILQAGMGAATSPALVAAVSNAGGLGIIGCLRRGPDEVRQLIAQITAGTTRQFAANHVIAHLNGAALEASLEAGAPLISTAWGDPAAVVQVAHAAGALVIHQVNTVEQAVSARDVGVDVVVAQGNEGGGHVGHLATFSLVPQVVDAVAPLPVLAAGGIADGRGVAAALMLGAAGVLVGTRFLATEEAPVAPAWKEAIRCAGGDQTVTTGFYDAMRAEVWPGAVVRAIRNRWTDEWGGREGEWVQVAEELRPEFLRSFAAGEFPMAGQAIGLISDVVPAGGLVQRIWQEASALLHPED